MGRKRPVGHCAICGVKGPLSYEHVPPRRAFNDHPVIEMAFEEAMNLGLDEQFRGRINQKGAGGYTLCESCNTLTGKWYAKRFIAWCHQGMSILQNSGGNPSLIYMQYLFPLAIIKQIITMFFSVNDDRFAQAHPELVRFILDRDRRYLSPGYGVYVYYNISQRMKRIPIAVKANTHNGTFRTMSEITFPPFGYLMTFNSPPPDRRLFNISHFADFDYEKFDVQELRLRVLPTHTMLPGDYRTEQEVRETYLQNMQLEREMYAGQNGSGMNG